MLQDLATRLKAIREAKGITKYRLAKVSGVSETYIYRIERGLIENPRRDTLQRLAQGLNIPLVQLIGETLPSDTWSLVEQSLKAYIPVYAGIGDGMEPVDFVACTQSRVPMNTVRGYKLEGLSCEPIIHEGDIIIVDRALKPADGDIVLVVAVAKPSGQEMRIAQYHKKGKADYLTDCAGKHKLADLAIHGTVTESIHRFKH